MLRATRPDGVAILTLNRPDKRNALSPALLRELGDLLTAAAADPTAGAIVLTGAGSAFCAGVDLAAIRAREVFPRDLTDRIAAAGVPVIAAVNGPAYTGGLELALACDFRIAGPTARFADTHATLGLLPAWGMSARLSAAVGQGWARQLSLTAEPIDAALALRIGLVNEVVADPVGRAVELAAAIAAADRHAVGTVRELYDIAGDSAAAGHRAERLARELTVRQPDSRQ